MTKLNFEAILNALIYSDVMIHLNKNMGYLHWIVWDVSVNKKVSINK